MGDCFNKTSQKYDSVDKETLGTLNSMLEEIKRTSKTAEEYASRASAVFESLNVQSQAQMRAKVANIAALRKEAAFRSQPGLIENPKAMFEAYVHGGALGNIEGGGIGIRREAADYRAMMTTDLIRKLDKAGTLKLAVEDKAFQKEMVRVAEALEKSPNSDVVKNASPLVLDSAKAWREFHNGNYEYKRSGNVPVAWRDGYVGIHTHSQEKLKAVTFEQWAQDIVPRLDLIESFKGISNPKDRISFLKDIYESVIDGKSDIHAADASAGLLSTPFERRSTLGSADKSRKLHFKDAGEWFDYNQKYGKHDNIMDMAMEEAFRAGLEKAQVERFGVNAQKGMVDFRDRIVSQAKANLKANPESKAAQKAFEEAKGLTDDYVRKAFSLVAGGGPPSNGMLDKAVRSYTSFGQARFLGGSVLSAIPDLGVSALAIKNVRTGRGFTEAVGTYLSHFSEAVSNKKELFTKLGLAVDDALSTMRFNDSESMIPGKLQQFSRFYNKLTGMKFWTENVVEAPVVLSAANDLFNISGSKFNDLGQLERQALARVGIGDAHWEVIRQAKENFNGRGIITNEGIDALPNDAVSKILSENKINRSASEFKIDTRRRLSSYYNDLAALASSRPDEITRKWMSLGQDPNSTTGMVARLLTQFKSYPLQFHRNIARFALAGTNELTFGDALKARNFNVGNLAQMAVSTAALTYVGMAAKRLAMNQTPDDFHKKETWYKLLRESGMAGVTGDLFFGEYVNRSGGSGIVGLLGPAVSDVDKIFQMYGSAARGESVTPKLYNFAKSMIPGNNLWYLKSALDYSIGYEIQEALNPGSVLKYQQRVQSEGRHFIFGSPMEALR